MLKAASTELKVGLFAAAIILILVYATIKVSETTFVSTGGYDLTVTLENVTGLKKKAPVELAGVPVGVIKKIELIDSNRARVTIQVEKKVKLPANSKAVLRTRGFLGETYVEIIPGDPDAGYTNVFKVELKNGSRQTGRFYVSAVTDKWTKTTIPLTDFRGIVDFSELLEFVIVFEDTRTTVKDGIIYVDDIAFE